MPLLVTEEIKLVDPTDEQPTDVEWRFTEDGERIRVSTRSGSIIPKPTKSEETVDYKHKSNYVEHKVKDTAAKAVEEITYEPKLCTFEMDIMGQAGDQRVSNSQENVLVLKYILLLIIRSFSKSQKYSNLKKSKQFLPKNRENADHFISKFY